MTTATADVEPYRYLGDVRKLTLKPDDIVVVTHKDDFSPEEEEQIMAQLKHHFPDNKCIVLAEGLGIGVMSPDDGDTVL